MGMMGRTGRKMGRVRRRMRRARRRIARSEDKGELCFLAGDSLLVEFHTSSLLLTPGFITGSEDKGGLCLLI